MQQSKLTLYHATAVHRLTGLTSSMGCTEFYVCETVTTAEK